MGNTVGEYEIDEKKIGFPYSDNKIYRMVKEAKTSLILKEFQSGNADCYQIIEESSAHTIVHESIVLDRRELFKLCQVYGADWNQPDANGITPLMKAAALNRTFYVDRLIELGVKIDQTDKRGRSASDYAHLYENHEIAERLQELLK